MRGQPRKSSFVEMLVDVSQKQQEKEWGAALKERDKLTKRESELQTIQRKQCIGANYRSALCGAVTRFYSRASANQRALKAAGRTA
jgi:hypothetical protein